MADNNNFWNTVGQSALGGLGGSLLGSIGSQLGYGLGEITGYNDKLRKEQLDQQKALTTLQYNSNYNLMKASYEQQYDLWNKTNYPAQIQQLQQAGLNPALLYAKGGSGGTTGSGGASVGGGQASDVASLRRSNTEQQMAGMAMMKLASEIKLNEAMANKTNAEGKNIWIETIRKHFEDWYPKDAQPEEAMIYEDKNYGQHTLNYNSVWSSTRIAELTQKVAETGNQTAQALLSNNKAMGYWTELANATKNADSQAIQAAAIKLAAEFNYGEYTNWKFWVKTGKEAFQLIK